LCQHRRAARLGAALGPGRPGRRPAALLPVLPARRRRPAAARDGLHRQTGRGAAAADAADQRGAGAVARPGPGHRVADRGGGARRGGLGRGGPPHGAVTPAPHGAMAARQTGGRRLRSMSGELEPAGPAESVEYLPGRARWAAIVGFAAVTAAGVVRLNPSPAAAAAGAVVAVGAAALLLLGWRPVLLYAALATAGIAVLG